LHPIAGQLFGWQSLLGASFV